MNDKHTHAEIAAAIRAAVREQGRTLASVALECNLPYATLERIQNGQSRGSVEVRDRILTALDNKPR